MEAIGQRESGDRSWELSVVDQQRSVSGVRALPQRTPAICGIR